MKKTASDSLTCPAQSKQKGIKSNRATLVFWQFLQFSPCWFTLVTEETKGLDNKCLPCDSDLATNTTAAHALTTAWPTCWILVSAHGSLVTWASFFSLTCEWYPSQLLYLWVKTCKGSWSLCRFWRVSTRKSTLHKSISTCEHSKSFLKLVLVTRPSSFTCGSTWRSEDLIDWETSCGDSSWGTHHYSQWPQQQKGHTTGRQEK